MTHILDSITPRRSTIISTIPKDDMDAIIRARERGLSWHQIYDALLGQGSMPYASLESFSSSFPYSATYKAAVAASSNGHKS